MLNVDLATQAHPRRREAEEAALLAPRDPFEDDEGTVSSLYSSEWQDSDAEGDWAEYGEGEDPVEELPWTKKPRVDPPPANHGKRARWIH